MARALSTTVSRMRSSLSVEEIFDSHTVEHLDLPVEFRVLHRHRHLIGEARQEDHLLLGEVAGVPVRHHQRPERPVHAPERHRQGRAQPLGREDRAGFRIPGEIAAGILDRQRFPTGDYPASHPLAGPKADLLESRFPIPHEDRAADLPRGAIRQGNAGCICREQVPSSLHHRADDAINLQQRGNLHSDPMKSFGLLRVTSDLGVSLEESLGHLIERVSQPANLVAGGHRHPTLERPMRDICGGRVEVA